VIYLGNTKNQKKIFLIASLIILSLVVVLIINIPFAFEKDPRVLPSDDDVTIQKTIPPSVEITVLKKDTKTSSFVVKGVSVSDKDHLTPVEVKLDDGPYKIATPKADDDWSEWSVSFDASSITDGTHSASARVLDDDEDKGWYSRDFSYLSNTLPIEIHDDFSEELYSMNLGGLSPNKNLFAIWHDNGTLGVIDDYANEGNNVFLVQSGIVTEKNKTKSALVLSSHEYKNFKLSVDVRTDQQLRKNDPPNAWEVGWVIWTYQNPTHFNYFLLKSVGAEYGKYDGGVNPTNQKKLYTSSLPTTSIGEWSHWEIIVKDTHVTIFVNDGLVFEFDDFASFDTGRIGFYLEDAAVSFDNLKIIPL